MRWLYIASAVAVAVATAPVARADDNKDERGKHSADAKASFFAEVMVLHATNDHGGIDPRIGKMPQLGKPPFSSYDTYRLLKKAKLPLKKGDPKTLKLPNKRILQTKLLAILPEDSVRISASINQPKGESFLPLLEVKAKVGQAFIVAGQSYKKGILVLVIRVVK